MVIGVLLVGGEPRGEVPSAGRESAQRRGRGSPMLRPPGNLDEASGGAQDAGQEPRMCWRLRVSYDLS
jgi:hypothetical protein